MITGPIRSLMPHWVIICRAIWVARRRSSAAPELVSWNSIFSLDGEKVLSATDRHVTLWDIKKKKIVWDRDIEVTECYFLEEKILCSKKSGDVMVFLDLETGKDTIVERKGEKNFAYYAGFIISYGKNNVLLSTNGDFIGNINNTTCSPKGTYLMGDRYFDHGTLIYIYYNPYCILPPK